MTWQLVNTKTKQILCYCNDKKYLENMVAQATDKNWTIVLKPE
jgi:hypothetical protein